jgi:hypothetical protein
MLECRGIKKAGQFSSKGLTRIASGVFMVHIFQGRLASMSVRMDRQ